MEVNRDRNGVKFNMRITYAKYTMFLLNIVFVIASVLAISSAVSTKVAFTSYYDMMVNGFDTLTTMWLVVGIIFLIVAVFGIFAAFKESTVLANLYGVAMVLVFILQLAASVNSFIQIDQTANMVSGQLITMMKQYSFGGYRQQVDWIQSKFECCGISSPRDWQTFDRFQGPHDYVVYYHDTDHTQNSEPDLMPISCCTLFSNYVNLTCEHYHESGCLKPLHQIVSGSIMVIGTSGLIFSSLQILGVILGFAYARIVRSKKTQRDVQIWNSSQGYPISPHQQTHVDYSPIHW